MRILMQNRINTFSVPGGDTVQMTKTKEYLEKMGAEVDISLELEPDLTNYDVVHLFNFWRIQETYVQAKNAQKYGKPIILSTIYWNNEEYEKLAFSGLRKVLNTLLPIDFIEQLKGLIRYFKDKEKNLATRNLIQKGRKKLQLEVLNMVNFFLPNAELEMELLMKDFNFNTKNYMVVPNAVDIDVFNYEEVKIDEIRNKLNVETEVLKDSILCVARIEPRKNQLQLVKALKDTDFKVILVGNVAPNHSNYLERIKREMADNVTILGSIPHESLPYLYKLAKVHVLPSWFDTPGLSSLEAAAMKCNIVVTDKGTTTEYFGKDAYYCDPENIEDIKRKVSLAFNSPVNEELFKKTREKYNWQTAAQISYSAYKKVL